MNDRIADSITHVTKTARADDQQTDHETHNRNGGVVGLGITLFEVTTQTPGEAEAVEELPEELEPAVRRGSVAGETEGEFSLDRSAQKAFSISHRECPFGSGEERSRQLFLYDRKSRPARQKAASFVSAAFFFSSVLTDQG
jgi:hypothetical protein